MMTTVFFFLIIINEWQLIARRGARYGNPQMLQKINFQA